MIQKQGGKPSGETLEERIANLFLTVGIPAHIKGYQYPARSCAHGDG